MKKHEHIMRQRAISSINNFSYDEETIDKDDNDMELNEKLEKYKILLEKQYEIRSKLKKSARLDDQRRCVSFCDCGREIPSSDIYYSCYKNVNNTSQLRDTKSDESRDRLYVHPRPLSADHIKPPTAGALRKLIAQEKADKRRASLKSLEDDFKTARMLLGRKRAETISEVSVEKSEACVNKESFDHKCVTMKSQVIANLKEATSPATV